MDRKCRCRRRGQLEIETLRPENRVNPGKTREDYLCKGIDQKHGSRNREHHEEEREKKEGECRWLGREGLLEKAETGAV